jgi:hypothetical protein
MTNGYRLEVRDLRLLTAVAAEGSLTGAGYRLHVTQPALSRHLGGLERRVGLERWVADFVRAVGADASAAGLLPAG